MDGRSRMVALRRRCPRSGTTCDSDHATGDGRAGPGIRDRYRWEVGATTGLDERRNVWSTTWWWCLTLLTLVVLDDLTFGPAFWAISRLAGAVWAVVAIYAIYVPVQLFLVDRGTRSDPGRIASWFLTRLDLQRRHPEIRRNELRLRAKVLGLLSSVGLSLLIGGVLPPLILHRRGFPRRVVLPTALVTSLVYATEFAVLHGLIPALI